MSTTVITDAYLDKVVDGFKTSFNQEVLYFRIGEGGWQDNGSGTDVPRDPDPTLTNLDCIENPTRYPTGSTYFFQKAVAPGKITELTSTSVRVECLVDTTEANDDGTGVSPEFWELGIFDADGTMITYTTFSRQPKDDTVALRHYITIGIARA